MVPISRLTGREAGYTLETSPKMNLERPINPTVQEEPGVPGNKTPTHEEDMQTQCEKDSKQGFNCAAFIKM